MSVLNKTVSYDVEDINFGSLGYIHIIPFTVLIVRYSFSRLVPKTVSTDATTSIRPSTLCHQQPVMLQHSICLGLALWATSADAFFAYCPAWHPGCDISVEVSTTVTSRGAPASVSVPGVLTFELGQRAEADLTPSHSEKAVREAARLAKKFARRTTSPPTHLLPPSSPSRLQARKNTYNIDPAAKPTQKFSVGIDQDGTDFSYFAEVSFGSNAKKLYMLTDTGAGTSWVMSSDCSSSPCSLHNSFGPDDSTSLHVTKDVFSIGYSTGSVKGVVARDRIQLGGSISVEHEFGIADSITDEFTHFPFDGILGLARNDGRTAAFLTTLKEAKILDKNMFAFYLGRAADGPNLGELSFGATDRAKFEGEITYVPLTDKAGDWIIPLDSVSYGGKTVVDSLPAYIDTGTTYFFGPPDAVRDFHNAISGAKTSDNVTYTVPCDVTTEPMLKFSGREFPISLDDWLSPPKNGLCTSNIYGIEVLKGSWLIGGTFLKNVYSVFDDDNARIGKARNADYTYVVIHYTNWSKGFAKKAFPTMSTDAAQPSTTDGSPNPNSDLSPTSASSSPSAETPLPTGAATALSSHRALIISVFVIVSALACMA